MMVVGVVGSNDNMSFIKAPPPPPPPPMCTELYQKHVVVVLGGDFDVVN
jgi:hypothetical protein